MKLLVILLVLATVTLTLLAFGGVATVLLMRRRAGTLPAPTTASRIEDIIAIYLDDHDFEDARDRLHTLGPDAAKQVLAAALDPGCGDELGVLVMTLADTDYPPALPAMRNWVHHEDIESVVIPALHALNQACGAPCDVDTLYSNWDTLDQVRNTLTERWDAGGQSLPTEDQWLKAKRAKRQAQIADSPPLFPGLTADETAEFRPALILLRKVTEPATNEQLHPLDLAACERLLPVYEQRFPNDPRLRDAVETVFKFLQGTEEATSLVAHEEPVVTCIREANDIAAWNPVHNRYTDPSAKAAAHVAQAVKYLISTEKRNRVASIHSCLDALEYSGAGIEGMRGELKHHLDVLQA